MITSVIFKFLEISLVYIQREGTTSGCGYAEVWVLQSVLKTAYHAVLFSLFTLLSE